MWTRFSLMRWLFLLALLLMSCSGCSAADWTLTRTHSHPLAELRARRQAPPPQVVVIQVPQAQPTTALRPPVLSVEPTPGTVGPLLTVPSPVSIAPTVVAAPVTGAITIPTVPAAPALPRKTVKIEINK